MRIGLLILVILAIIFVAGFLLGRGFLATDFELVENALNSAGRAVLNTRST